MKKLLGLIFSAVILTSCAPELATATEVIPTNTATPTETPHLTVTPRPSPTHYQLQPIRLFPHLRRQRSSFSAMQP